MRKTCLILGLGLFIALPLQAQGTYPRAEIFGGYSFLHDARFEGNIPRGWEASFAGNFHRMIGIEADFSGHYRGGEVILGPASARYTRTNFLFGPKFAARLPKVTPWGHALFGAAHLGVRGRNFVGDYSDSATGFAWAVGGGVDVRLHRNLSARLIQADYLWTKDSTEIISTGHTGTYWGIDRIRASSNLRLSFGAVFTFGGD